MKLNTITLTGLGLAALLTAGISLATSPATNTENNARIAALESTVAGLTNNINTLQNVLVAASDTIDILRTDLDAANKTIDTMAESAEQAAAPQVYTW